MKPSRITKEQIVGILADQETGSFARVVNALKRSASRLATTNKSQRYSEIRLLLDLFRARSHVAVAATMAIRMKTFGLLSTLVIAATTGAHSTVPAEHDFLRANAVAMKRMMVGMAAKPAGNVDVDFVNMMEPHHQGAIDMAVLELRYGHNEQLRGIAQEIVVDQQQEIGAMRLALGRPLPASSPAPTQLSPSPDANAVPHLERPANRRDSRPEERQP